ncbi:hypothetical protein DCD74_04470 [Lysobacter oculi]|uniref:TonB C-terminal domain-containing protein n=2 Tax=Solilutibacter oculi TaxID=2698682 RepID=A0A344J4U1_9GAMM|nr:hypothetical protein DCD74_04470 [Lysobacter oculi]
MIGMSLRRTLLASAVFSLSLSVHAAPPQPTPPPLPAPPAAEMPLPKVISRVDPIYPPQAICLGTGGTTKVLVNINAQGTVDSASVAYSSGNRALDRAAVTAIRQWTFESPGAMFSGYVDVNFEADGGPLDDCLQVATFGGLVGETPGYEPGSLEVLVHLLPSDAGTFQFVILDTTGATLETQTLAAEQVPGMVRFKGLKAGEHILSIRADGVELRHSTFTVLDNGSVMTPPPTPPAED